MGLATWGLHGSGRGLRAHAHDETQARCGAAEVLGADPGDLWRGLQTLSPLRISILLPRQFCCWHQGILAAVPRLRYCRHGEAGRFKALSSLGEMAKQFAQK